MPGHKNKQCRYGSFCETKRCPFKHPAIEFFGREEKPADDFDQARFESELRSFEHSVELNRLIESIEYVAWSDFNCSYIITNWPELGAFDTWDDAYDALLAATYSS